MEVGDPPSGSASIHPKWAQALSLARSQGTRAFCEGGGGGPPLPRQGRAPGAGPSPSGGGGRRGAARATSPASTRAHARGGPAHSAASPIARRKQSFSEPAAGALACSAGLGGAQRPGPGGCGPGRPGS